jgi:hypothetical protein
MNGQRYRKYYLQLWFDEYTEWMTMLAT